MILRTLGWRDIQRLEVSTGKVELKGFEFGRSVHKLTWRHDLCAKLQYFIHYLNRRYMQHLSKSKSECSLIFCVQSSLSYHLKIEGILQSRKNALEEPLQY